VRAEWRSRGILRETNHRALQRNLSAHFVSAHLLCSACVFCCAAALADNKRAPQSHTDKLFQRIGSFICLPREESRMQLSNTHVWAAFRYRAPLLLLLTWMGAAPFAFTTERASVPKRKHLRTKRQPFDHPCIGTPARGKVSRWVPFQVADLPEHYCVIQASSAEGPKIRFGRFRNAI